MTRISLTLDGESRHDDVEPRRLLADWLVDQGRPGPAPTCDDARCGSCTVHLDGRGVKSCTVLAVQADGSDITTLAGLTGDGGRHAVQEALEATGAVPCPGVVMQLAQVLGEHPSPSADQLRLGLAGHQCACVSEEDLADAVLASAQQRQPGLASVEGGAS